MTTPGTPHYSPHQWTPEELAAAKRSSDGRPFKIPMIPPQKKYLAARGINHRFMLGVLAAGMTAEFPSAAKKSEPDFLRKLASAAFLTALSVAVLFVSLAVYFHG